MIQEGNDEKVTGHEKFEEYTNCNVKVKRMGLGVDNNNKSIEATRYETYVSEMGLVPCHQQINREARPPLSTLLGSCLVVGSLTSDHPFP